MLFGRLAFLGGLDISFLWAFWDGYFLFGIYWCFVDGFSIHRCPCFGWDDWDLRGLVVLDGYSGISELGACGCCRCASLRGRRPCSSSGRGGGRSHSPAQVWSPSEL